MSPNNPSPPPWALPLFMLLSILLLLTGQSAAQTSSSSALSWCDPNGTIPDLTILAMGASIVYGHSSTSEAGFRPRLAQLLETSNMTASMVGTQWSGNMLPSTYSNHHEAYEGATIEGYAVKIAASGAYNMNANVLMILLGTNDCWWLPNTDPEITAVEPDERKAAGLAAMKRFTTFLAEIHSHAPDALVLVAELPKNGQEHADRCIQGFDAALPAVVEKAVEEGQSLVRFVRMYDVVSYDQIQVDGTHPTDRGYDLMGERWFEAIRNATEELCPEREELEDSQDQNQEPPTSVGNATAPGSADSVPSTSSNSSSELPQSGGTEQATSADVEVGKVSSASRAQVYTLWSAWLLMICVALVAA
ncbi:hypothetical protein LTR97_006971 [Elasticomyces elasticus]|uniref:SGNH hydrolase-type esterase domain-containing protein n=1 Tax=Elasticomyces elasticus TaxID=574655 RepID=A0AAN7WFE7_9PEZI|nr:hypothetical protein LTR97_006971 [Elasticomyces elasticus]